MIRLRLLLFICLISPMVQLLAQDRQQLQEEIEKIIYYETNIDLRTEPGYLIGIIMGDSTFIYPYGSTTKDSLQAPDQSTLFEIGGMTKVFTASVVRRLIQEGVLHADSTLNHYLPSAYRNVDCQSITIGQLVHHVSGLPRMPTEFGVQEQEDNNPYAHYSKEDLLQFYQDYEGPSSNTSYLYSNLGYALLELAIEFTMEQSFEKVLQEKVLLPLGMEQTKIRLSDEDKGKLAKGYAKSGKETQSWEFRSFAASEGVKTNLADLLRFTQFNMNAQGNPVANSFEAMHQPFEKTAISQDSYVANGWHVIKNKKYYNLVLHPGSTSGFRAFCGFIKETRTAVVILSNSEYGTNGLGQHIIRMLNFNWKKKKKKKRKKG